MTSIFFNKINHRISFLTHYLFLSSWKKISWLCQSESWLLCVSVNVWGVFVSSIQNILLNLFRALVKIKKKSIDLSRNRAITKGWKILATVKMRLKNRLILFGLVLITKAENVQEKYREFMEIASSSCQVDSSKICK